MIRLKDFLKIANDPVIIRNEDDNVLRINDTYFDKDLLSDKLLNSEVTIVEAEDYHIIVRLKEEMKND